LAHIEQMLQPSSLPFHGVLLYQIVRIAHLQLRSRPWQFLLCASCKQVGNFSDFSIYDNLTLHLINFSGQDFFDYQYTLAKSKHLGDIQE